MSTPARRIARIITRLNIGGPSIQAISLSQGLRASGFDTCLIHGHLAELVSMFAFAIWDEPKRRLWLVRDRLGKKPPYYTEAGGTLRFASELKALVGDPEVPRNVDPAAIRLYLRYGYVPSPYTIYSGIHKLSPAHHLICERGRVTIQLGIRPEPIRRLWADFQSGRTHRTDLLWQMFTLATWSRRFRRSGAAMLTA